MQHDEWAESVAGGVVVWAGSSTVEVLDSVVTAPAVSVVVPAPVVVTGVPAPVVAPVGAIPAPVGRTLPALGLAAAVVVLVLALADTKVSTPPNPAAGRPLGQAAWWNRTIPIAVPLADPEPVVSAVFAPDGRTLATGSATGLIRLWDTRSGRIRFTLTALGELRQVEFSPDGRTVAAAGLGNTVHTWEAETGRLLKSLSANRFAFTPDGRALVTGDAAGRIKVWEPGVDRPAPVLVLRDSPVTDLVVGPDSGRVAVRTQDGVTRVQALRTAERLLTLPTEGHGALAFSADGGQLIAGDDVAVDLPLTSAAMLMQSWDISTGRLRSSRPVAARGGLPGVVFTPDGRLLMTGDRAGRVRVEDVATGQVRHELVGLRAEATAVLSADGHLLATANRDCLRVWDLTRGRVRFSLPVGRDEEPPGLAFSPSGRVLAVIRKDAGPELWTLP